MNRVKMHHPKTGGTYMAPESAVATLALSGWVRADEHDAGGVLPPGATEVRNDTGESEPVITENKPPRGRRKNEEG